MCAYKKLKNMVIQKLNREVMDVVVGATGLTPSEITQVAAASSAFISGAQTPSPKSISGATDIYLNKIMKDFPNYSTSDAEKELREGIFDFIAVRYQGKTESEILSAGPNVLPTIERADRVCEVSNIKIHRFAIAGYKKSEEYATVSYQAACGFDLKDAETKETKHLENRYKMDYSLRFAEDGTTAYSYTCPNCNAALGANTKNECPYCGARIVMDTIYSWYIASIVEE